MQSSSQCWQRLLRSDLAESISALLHLPAAKTTQRLQNSFPCTANSPASLMHACNKGCLFALHAQGGEAFLDQVGALEIPDHVRQGRRSGGTAMPGLTQARDMLMLTAVPATLPCRESERQQVEQFVQDVLDDSGELKGGVGKGAMSFWAAVDACVWPCTPAQSCCSIKCILLGITAAGLPKGQLDTLGGGHVITFLPAGHMMHLSSSIMGCGPCSPTLRTTPCMLQTRRGVASACTCRASLAPARLRQCWR